jgi:histidine triad (HIT) family protein
MANDCTFCRIARGEIPARIVYQDALITAFHDARPQAPTHILVIPNHHVPSLNHTTEEDTLLLGQMLAVARDLAVEHGLSDGGYRLVLNTGRNGGQSVFHMHLHVLGGRRMTWPPG